MKKFAKMFNINKLGWKSRETNIFYKQVFSAGPPVSPEVARSFFLYSTGNETVEKCKRLKDIKISVCNTFKI